MRSPSLRYLLLSLVSVTLLLCVQQTVSACSCGPRPTVLDEFDTSDEVVIGRVISVEKVPKKDDNSDERYYVNGVRSTTVIIEKVFKGELKVRDEIVFEQGMGGNCVWAFGDKSVGVQFLFYLNRPEELSKHPYPSSKENVFWSAGNCGRSDSLAGVADDLLYLENLNKLRGKTRISGRLSGWNGPEMDVEDKKIKIIGPKKTYVTKTNKNGVFEIYDLPPGKYFVEPETLPGWTIHPFSLRYSPSVIRNRFEPPEMKSPGQLEIVLEPKKHAGVEIFYAIENFVRGRVLGPKGSPMFHVCVSLLGSEREEWSPTGCTDEEGRFEITSIPKGEYVLVANKDDKTSGRQPFGKIFYPNVLDRERAVKIHIGPGETIENLDIVIPKLEETITIEGVLRHSDGKPVTKGWVKFKVTKTDDKIDGDVSEQTDNMGRFTLRVLKGLTGELAAEDRLIQGYYKNCPKVDELIAKTGDTIVPVQTNVIKLTTEQNVYDVELTFPFPRCEKVNN